jgi:hypothetical protein
MEGRERGGVQEMTGWGGLKGGAGRGGGGGERETDLELCFTCVDWMAHEFTHKACGGGGGPFIYLCMPICPSAYLSANLSVWLSVYLSACVCVYWNVCMYVCV